MVARFPKWHKVSHPPTHKESKPNNGSQPTIHCAAQESSLRWNHLVVVPVLSSTDCEARGWSPPAKRSINFVRKRGDHPLKKEGGFPFMGTMMKMHRIQSYSSRIALCVG